MQLAMGFSSLARSAALHILLLLNIKQIRNTNRIKEGSTAQTLLLAARISQFEIATSSWILSRMGQT